MEKLKFLSILVLAGAAVAYAASGGSNEATVSLDSASMNEVEECRVVDKDGKNLIKAGMADGVGEYNVRERTINKEGEKDAWIWLEKGWCSKLNAAIAKGDFKDLPFNFKFKLRKVLSISLK